MRLTSPDFTSEALQDFKRPLADSHCDQTCYSPISDKAVIDGLGTLSNAQHFWLQKRCRFVWEYPQNFEF